MMKRDLSGAGLLLLALAIGVLLSGLGAGLLAGRAAAATDAYQVDIVGTDDAALSRAIHDAADLYRRRREPLLSLAQLQGRARSDQAKIEGILRGLGYYDGTVKIEIDEAGHHVTIRLHPGPVYRITAYRVVEAGGGAARIAIDRKALGVPAGTAASGAIVVEAERRILQAYFDAGYPLAKASDRRVVIDHATRSASVTETIAPGPQARIGAIAVTGLKGVEEAFVRGRLHLAPGQLFTRAAIEKARTNLVGTNLFSAVKLSWPDHAAPDGTLPLTVALTERRFHSFGGGLSYSTDLGPTARAFWEDRNLFGSGELLRFEGRFGQTDRSLTATFRKPDWLSIDQTLNANLALLDQDFPAYRLDSARGGFGIERPLFEDWIGGVGLSLEKDITKERDARFNQLLLGVPLTLSRDTSDDPLDPKHGMRLTLSATPYASLGEGPSFLTLRARDTLYQSLSEDGHWILAGWVGLGSVVGPQRDQLPRSQHLFAGGGGSVRGYAYQFAGPVDRHDDPIGGMSLVEAGTELRIRITDTIGVVPFIEAASVGKTSAPTLSDIFVGAGVGLRYYSSIGPIRLDVATPISPRRSVDAPVQIYVSIGQAF
jgi:translocation and assembly module TamA